MLVIDHKFINAVLVFPRHIKNEEGKEQRRHRNSKNYSLCINASMQQKIQITTQIHRMKKCLLEKIIETNHMKFVHILYTIFIYIICFSRMSHIQIWVKFVCQRVKTYYKRPPYVNFCCRCCCCCCYDGSVDLFSSHNILILQGEKPICQQIFKGSFLSYLFLNILNHNNFFSSILLALFVISFAVCLFDKVMSNYHVHYDRPPPQKSK